MKKNYSLFFLIITLTFLLTSCTQNVSVENRDFADTIGIDIIDINDKKMIEVTLLIPDPSKIASGESKEVNQIIISEGENFTLALKNAEYESSNVLSLENVRTILIGEDLAKDSENLALIFDAIKRNSSISKRVILCVSKGTAKDVLTNEIKNITIIGDYLTDYYNQSQNEIFNAYDKKLSKLISKLNVIHNAILPQIYIEESKLNLENGVLFKNGEYIDVFNDDILRGYALVVGDIKNIIINVDFENTSTPITIKSKKSDNYFEEVNNKLVYNIVQNYDLSLTEFHGEVSKIDITTLSELFNLAVENDIKSTLNYFVNENSSDIYGFKDKLKKEDYDLYLKYANNTSNEKLISSLDFKIDISSRIINTGSTR